MVLQKGDGSRAITCTACRPECGGDPGVSKNKPAECFCPPKGAGQFPCVFKTMIVILIYFKFLKRVILKWMYIPFGLTSRLEQEEELNGLRGSGTLPTADLDPSSSAASAVLCRAF